MSVPPGEYSDSGQPVIYDLLPIPLRVSPGFPPGSLDNVASATIALWASACNPAAAPAHCAMVPATKPRIGGQGSPVRDRRGPATVTEQQSPPHAVRQPLAPKGLGRRDGKLGSQETSLRSLPSSALVERGYRMPHQDLSRRRARTLKRSGMLLAMVYTRLRLLCASALAGKR